MPTIIIPARLGSTRLPCKSLLCDTGFPLIWHTASRALESKINDIIIATEDNEIMDVVKGWNHPRIHPIKTPICNSGSERISWVVRNVEFFDFSFVVNFQGDEPELPGKYVDELINALVTNHTIDVATLVTPVSLHDYYSDSVVKVVLDHNKNAMYFSRSPIPHGIRHENRIKLAHVGIYAYRLDFLLAMPTLLESTLQSEELEQLQWLQSGFKIRVLEKDLDLVGIDTQEEYDRFVKRERKRKTICPPPPPPPKTK